MKYLKNCIFCKKELMVSTVKGSGGFLFLVDCGESDSVHEFAISQRGDPKLNRHPSKVEAVKEGIKDFKLKYPTEIPQVFFDEKWELSIVQLIA
jgi:hypothetical protein